MKKTVGTQDRAVRGVLAIGALIGAGLVGFTSGWGLILVAVVAIMLVTGASGYCPIYSALGIDTRRHDQTGAPRHTLLHSHKV